MERNEYTNDFRATAAATRCNATRRATDRLLDFVCGDVGIFVGPKFEIGACFRNRLALDFHRCRRIFRRVGNRLHDLEKSGAPSRDETRRAE